MKTIQKAAIIYLTAIIFMSWGIMVGVYKIFPYQVLQEVKDFIDGDDLGKNTTIVQKVANDIGLVPQRFMREFPDNAKARTQSVSVSNLKSRRDMPMVYVSKDHQSGYRAIFGALDFENTFWGGVLLSPTGKAIHTWELSTDHLSTNTVNDELKNLYGLHLFQDGSIIFSQQERGGGIVKVDACSKVQWNVEGDFHHTITASEDGGVWTFAGMQDDFDHKLTKLSQETGEIISVIDMAEVRKANPYLHIFNLQKKVDIKDISHGNDIEPLPSNIASRFEKFKAGDLLISYRTQNLVFILDPDTLEVKWWRIGSWDRQHDPDWEIDGSITVFSNNQVTNRISSDIVSIDPNSFESKVILNGDSINFYSDINGDHQRSEFGTRMVTSTTQGWTFEIDTDNKIIFSFVNAYDIEKNSSLNISEAQRLPEDYFKEEFWKKCAN